MKLITRGIGILGLLGAASIAQAGVTSTWTLTNDYDFRGFSQSGTDPAIQGSLDYAHPSGFYVGAWASNIDFGPATGGFDRANIEVDLYGGFTKTIESTGITWDAGLVEYAYPDESGFNYLEVYGSVAKGWFKGKLWYSPDFGGDTTAGDTEAWYLDFNGTFPLPQNLSLIAHAGYSTGDYWDALDDVLDYSIGFGYTVKKINLTLKYVDQETDIRNRGDIFNNEGRVIFSVATTFPWGE